MGIVIAIARSFGGSGYVWVADKLSGCLLDDQVVDDSMQVAYVEQLSFDRIRSCALRPGSEE